MAFNPNSERTKPTLELEAGVPQYRWTEGVDAVPSKMSKQAIDQTFADWREEANSLRPAQKHPLGVACRLNAQWHIGKVDGGCRTAKTAEVTVTLGEGRQDIFNTRRSGHRPSPCWQGLRVCSRRLTFAVDADGRMMLFQTGDALPMYLAGM